VGCCRPDFSAAWLPFFLSLIFISFYVCAVVYWGARSDLGQQRWLGRGCHDGERAVAGDTRTT
jgi:hypothetical protein